MYIECPNCKKEMEEQWRERLKTEQPIYEIVAHCWHCDYDASIEISIDPTGKETILSTRQFFFG